jgi:predicted  nucleic acid-binding Zn-ribbon protein
MSAAERKSAAADLSTEIKSQKEALKDANLVIKDLEKQLKAVTKERDAIAKGLLGLNARKAALSPPKPLVG